MSFSSSTSNVSGHIEVNLLSVFLKRCIINKNNGTLERLYWFLQY